MVYDEALVPAIEVFVGPNLHLQLLQQGLVGSLAHGMHRGTNIVQDAHDARRILKRRKQKRSRGKKEITDYLSTTLPKTKSYITNPF